MSGLCWAMLGYAGLCSCYAGLCRAMLGYVQAQQKTHIEGSPNLFHCVWAEGARVFRGRNNPQIRGPVSLRFPALPYFPSVSFRCNHHLAQTRTHQRADAGAPQPQSWASDRLASVRLLLIKFRGRGVRQIFRWIIMCFRVAPFDELFLHCESPNTRQTHL